MLDKLKEYPERIPPYILQTDLNQPVLVLNGPLRFAGSQKALLHTDLFFRWLPSTAVEFDGLISQGYFNPEAEWSILAAGEIPLCAPVHITRTTISREATRVKGVLKGSLNIGGAPFQTLQFSLVNFPDYLGAPVRYEMDETIGLMHGRLHLVSDQGTCKLDVVPEASEFRQRADQDAGFIVSHVGQWQPSSEMSLQDAEEVLAMLRIWFGFLRGAWAGPLFPQGLRQDAVVWRQFAAWTIQESRPVPTWLPDRRPVDLSQAFSGFIRLWKDPAWQSPLKLAVSWLVEANGSRIGVEAKIILAQVALELLASVYLLETQGLQRRKDLKALSAVERIRALLSHIGVPVAIPDHMTQLAAAGHATNTDGPGVITSARNQLVHAVGKSSNKKLNGHQLFECSQLAVQYIELSILFMCGYQGHYVRRAWQGWKGDDALLVPWCAVD